MGYDALMAPRSDATSGAPSAVPELELDTRQSAASRTKPKGETHEEAPLELAIDPRQLVDQRSEPSPRAAQHLAPPVAGAPLAPVDDLAFDAHLLADYGEPPRHWLLSPLYAYRVFKRRRELKAALAGRREEAARAASEAEDALIEFAERARPTSERTPMYGRPLDELRAAEELLRSRDKVLAAEQDAQNARLAQVDARLVNLEAELAQAQSEERAIGLQLSDAQGALGREEARLKRAETELRAANQRAGETDGTSTAMSRRGQGIKE